MLKGEGDKMTQKQWFRDVWGLGIPTNGYPGAFPRGLINRIKKRWWKENRVWLFSGSFKDSEGITIDINADVKPDIITNCEQLPLKDESFDFVMLDPPYSEEEAMRLYNLPYINLLKALNEAARICASGGYVLLLHRMIPFNHPESNNHLKRLKIIATVGVYTIAGWTNMRALTVWRKQETLEGWGY